MNGILECLKSGCVIAHRGSREMQNTIEGLISAKERGVKIVEIDVIEINGRPILGHSENELTRYTLNDALGLTELLFLVDVKSRNVDPIVDATMGFEERVMFSADNFETAYRLRSRSDCPVGLSYFSSGIVENPSRAVSLAIENELDALFPFIGALRKRDIKFGKENSMYFATCVVNDEATFALAKTYGVDGIITDFPEKFPKWEKG
ncbi:hypothetical protein HS7_13490 [Sulfolobales archaeon HS-7]|nr:hypothetical protein HS7_13490 [Sulfolobales archaeon HS-7]